ncbi:MAG TPA: NAD(P)-dependent oxidoreductase [Candidatus Marinimicrobia bacterium]|nr:NAD(P)-dependent oxidoreductase [Candidatus Neomarinimicrobiota bacterium]HRS52421.1 NAD(P)-dependent oxidoreductase [Candidatus Neomarinimicrobiota bacterium]HRU92510.1 NAD(P)-dependent oxidoreductase [Candidatus Neomarinimicrobiota bacterium]
MIDVFFYEAFQEEAEMIKRFLPENITAGFDWQTIQESKHNTPPARIISIRTQSIVPVSWLPKLSAILSRSTGYDHLIPLAQKAGSSLQVGYLPLYCNRSVAEQAILLALALLRKLPQQLQQFPQFNRDGLTGRECAGKTLLVVGVGNIGYEVVKIGIGLGMQVLGVDIVKKHSDVNYVNIEEGLPKADVIICAMNLTPENHNYFNADRLHQAKPGAIFVNIARGEQSPSTELLKLIQEGHLSGVGLDVYNAESELAVALRSGNPSQNDEVQATLALSKLPNVILTPHNAFNTYESVERKAAQSITQIQHFLESGKFLWPIPVDDR